MVSLKIARGYGISIVLLTSPCKVLLGYGAMNTPSSHVRLFLSIINVSNWPTTGDHLFIGNSPISQKYKVNLPDGDYIFEPHSCIYKSGCIKRWEVLKLKTQ